MALGNDAIRLGAVEIRPELLRVALWSHRLARRRNAALSSGRIDSLARNHEPRGDLRIEFNPERFLFPIDHISNFGSERLKVNTCGESPQPVAFCPN